MDTWTISQFNQILELLGIEGCIPKGIKFRQPGEDEDHLYPGDTVQSLMLNPRAMSSSYNDKPRQWVIKQEYRYEPIEQATEIERLAILSGIEKVLKRNRLKVDYDDESKFQEVHKGICKLYNTEPRK